MTTPSRGCSSIKRVKSHRPKERADRGPRDTHTSAAMKEIGSDEAPYSWMKRDSEEACPRAPAHPIMNMNVARGQKSGASGARTSSLCSSQAFRDAVSVW